MSFNETATQKIAIADVINNQSVNNTSVSSIGIDMSIFKRVLFIVEVPSVGAAGTVDGRLQSAAASNFATPHNLTSTNLSQITTNNALATIEVRSDQVTSQNSGDKYVRLNLTGGGNAVTVQAIGLGIDSVQHPGNANNLNTTYLGQQVVCTT